MMTAAFVLAFTFVIAILCGHPTEARELHFQSSSHEALIQKAWIAFKIQFAKTYSSAEEEQIRKVIFRNSLEIIEKHNFLYKSGRSTYKMGINQFADTNFTEFMQLSGYRSENGYGSRGSESSFSSVNAGDIPLEKDWRTEGYVTGVKNQGHCGSCWAFSATGSLEGQWKRKTGNLVSLSEQNLVDCSWDQGNHGCDGGLQTKAFAYIINNGGIDTEAFYPYEAKDGNCRYSKEYIGATVSSYGRVKRRSEDDLTKATATVGPISVAIAVTENLRLYKAGVFNDPMCQNKRLSHAVLVVGYGSTDGQDYYIVKNSWGTTWGDGGYILMARNNNNMCGIATEASYPIV